MRLSAIREILEGAPFGEGKLEIQSSVNQYQLGNIKGFKRLAEHLKVIPQFTPIVEGLEESELYGTARNQLMTDVQEGNSIAKLANGLYSGALSLFEMLRVAIPEERPESVAIKLPDITICGKLVKYS